LYCERVGFNRYFGGDAADRQLDVLAATLAGVEVDILYDGLLETFL
jgi:hypothetical protein